MAGDAPAASSVLAMMSMLTKLVMHCVAQRLACREGTAVVDPSSHQGPIIPAAGTLTLLGGIHCQCYLYEGLLSPHGLPGAPAGGAGGLQLHVVAAANRLSRDWNTQTRGNNGNC